jgi:uncharacterized protein with HEPN domain
VTDALDAAHEREQLRLQYIQESLQRITQYTAGGRPEFFRESIVQDAVLRRLETLADATHKLSDTLKARHPEVPWRVIYRFRNVAAHAYETIDLERVWEVIEHHLDALAAVVESELDAAPGESESR